MTGAAQGAPHVHSGLDRGISSPRFATFERAAEGDANLARDLYVWNRDLAVAFLADIAILEVALRNAIHDAATAQWGTHWYSNPAVIFDDRSTRQLSTAWNQLPKSVQRRPQDPDVPGRLVAQCMFGFWTNLLDAGGYRGNDPRRFSTDYDILWNAALKHAFPGGRLEARHERARILARSTSAAAAEEEPAFTRGWVHGVCKSVNDLRNRVAHHEPLINGVPLNGQGRRMSSDEAHRRCLMLARMVDRDLAAWLVANSTVPAVLGCRPRPAPRSAQAVPPT
ncbi:Abi family protein [Cellulomonas sp. KH9]|uniref:Abi family protein n=1 Tax=Cellulomonas sp. KH9 TaxID=1855324 RepID=UPI0008F1C12A|nr:Abi family protein [Cellulomonas sp. KH9]SFJ57465.1 Abi-like protein [Cellulomonas sp. KH9]